MQLSKYTSYLKELLEQWGIPDYWAAVAVLCAGLLAVGILALLLDYLCRRLIVSSFRVFALRTKTEFDDFLVESNFPRYVAHIIPLIFIKNTVPILSEDFEFFGKLFGMVFSIYTAVLVVKIIRSVFRAAIRFLRTKERFSDKPLESYVQVLLIFLWGIAGIYTIYVLTGKDVLSVASLGAVSAIVMLIFKDTILGFVASIQVSVNDIVRIGDWVVFNKFGADGTVTDINLATVRIQNWDKTYTTIPTYSLIADSFQNWRGMEESGGRRIKRSVFIKQSSICFLDQKRLDEMKKIQLVTDYIDHRQLEIERHNSRMQADKSVLINGRNQTNFGIFRKYIDTVLRQNTAVNQDMTIMVRQLQPTPQGIPLEIYCFCKDKRWVNYEAIMADIFDHVIAAAPYFDIELFETPTGKDFSSLKGKV